jgi:hypothetical protein
MQFSHILVFFVFVRLIGAAVNIVHDCDEVYNYWEPLHYLVHGSGMQTWEYRCPRQRSLMRCCSVRLLSDEFCFASAIQMRRLEFTVCTLCSQLKPQDLIRAGHSVALLQSVTTARKLMRSTTRKPFAEGIGWPDGSCLTSCCKFQYVDSSQV